MRHSTEIRTEIDKLMAEYSEAKETENRADQAYSNLNNLYLDIQKGDTILTRKVYNQLNDLLTQTYPRSDAMFDWWWREFQKLPGWLNV